MNLVDRGVYLCRLPPFPLPTIWTLFCVMQSAPLLLVLVAVVLEKFSNIEDVSVRISPLVCLGGATAPIESFQ